jgi:phosphoribosylanthranilate isomerase
LSAGVKICGLKTPDALEAAIAAGASHCGFVFFPPSPRYIAPEDAAALARQARGRIQSVALMVDLADDDIAHIVATLEPDMIQLHGSETPDRVALIRKTHGRPVIKSVSVGKPGDAERASDYQGAADLILFDARPPADGSSELPGGNGLPFDWRLLSEVSRTQPFMLSGGLTPDNVREAIALTDAALVDVSSGVERAPGVKDPDLIRRFVAAVRAVAAPADMRNDGLRDSA